ncbi:MAG: hydrogenase maturation protease [Actinomycetota bacterium]
MIVDRRVIGAGNAWRGDDAAGLAVADRVRAALPDADVTSWEGEPIGLLDMLDTTEDVVIVDAVSSGAAPGTIHRFDAAEGPIPAPFAGRGTHTLSIADAIELARALGRLPARVELVGVEGARFDAGAELSADVARAVAAVADDLIAQLKTGSV